MIATQAEVIELGDDLQDLAEATTEFEPIRSVKTLPLNPAFGDSSDKTEPLPMPTDPIPYIVYDWSLPRSVPAPAPTVQPPVIRVQVEPVVYHPEPLERSWFGPRPYMAMDAALLYGSEPVQHRVEPDPIYDFMQYQPAFLSRITRFVGDLSGYMVVWIVGMAIVGVVILTHPFWNAAQSDVYEFGIDTVLANNQTAKTELKPQQPIPAAPAPAAPSAPVPAGSHAIEGQPSITVAKITQVLQQYNSPAVDSAQAMYDLGVKYGIDPVYALAFFVHESTCGTRGIAVTTKSIGNIRQTAGSGFDAFQGFRKYPTWEAGMEDWYKLIKGLYVNSWGLKTTNAIIPRYAPSSENDTGAYINRVNGLVDTWRAGK